MMPYQEDNSYDMDGDGESYSNNNNNNNNINNNEVPRNKIGLSKAELRKSNKPIMEKKRRARINNCLNELKTLILEAMKKDPARHTKLEKADILEMTVKLLQTIQRQQLMSVPSTDNIVHKFKSGFADCAAEVNRYINQMEDVENPVKRRLINHLGTCVSGLQQINPIPFGNAEFSSASSTIGPMAYQSNEIPFTHDQNNNNEKFGLDLFRKIPELSSNNLDIPFLQSSKFYSQNTSELCSSAPRISAFNKVSKHNFRLLTTSPPLSPISSISSIGEETSTTITNDYYSVTTPPLQLQSNQSILNLFPTPSTPSGSSKDFISLQQPHISSTTVETPKSRTEYNNFNSKKRSHCVDREDLIQQPEKRLKNEVEQPNPLEPMWRPW